MLTLNIIEFSDTARDAAIKLRFYLGKACEEIYAGGNESLFKRVVEAAKRLTQAGLTEDQFRRLSDLSEGVNLSVAAPLSLQAVPFEFLRIGGLFLGERFAISRQVTDLDPLPKTGIAPSVATANAIQVIVAESPELIATGAEQIGALRKLRFLHHDHPGLVAEPVSPLRCPPKSTFLDLLSKSAWLHFAGHGIAEEDSRLNNDEDDGIRCLSFASRDQICAVKNADQEVPPEWMIAPDDLNRGKATPQTAFLNACGALAVPISDPNATTLVSQLLRQGTQWLLGPTVPVLDDQTRFFTDEFYNQIAKGHCMGEAVRLARLESRRRLGEYNLTGLSYVLYGDPAGSPFADLFPAPTDSRKPKEPKMNATKLKATFPLTCQRCDKPIETGDGIGRLSNGEHRDVICWSCYRKEKGDQPRHVAVSVRHCMTADQVPAVVVAEQQPIPQRELPPSVSAVARHIQECLDRTLSVPDVDGTGASEVTFQPIEELATDTLIPDDAASQYVSWEAQAAVSGLTDAASLRFVVLGGQRDADAVAADQIHLLLKAGSSEATEVHLFVVSEHGFTEEAQQLVQSDDPSAVPPACTLYLHDTTEKKTFHNPANLNSWRFAHLLQRASTSQQFSQAVDWLQDQLPLVTSLGSSTVADERQLEQDAVEAAMRLVAFQNSLHTEQASGFGLVLSDTPLPGVLARPESISGRSSISRSVSGIFRFLNRLWNSLQGWIK